MLHLTNPCAKRKVLTLTEPKGKIYKTKSLGHYITRKPNAYAYENQTSNQQKIPTNFKSTTQNTSDRQLDKKYWFCLQEGEGSEKEECLFRVRRKKERKRKKERRKEAMDKKKILSTRRITSTHTHTHTHTNQILVPRWIPQLLSPHVKNHHLMTAPAKKLSGHPSYIHPEEDHVASTLNENIFVVYPFEVFVRLQMTWIHFVDVHLWK